MNDIIGYIAFALTVLGNILLIYKMRKGWIVRLLCTILWLVYAVSIMSYPLILNTLVYLGINSFGWWKWWKESKNEIQSV